MITYRTHCAICEKELNDDNMCSDKLCFKEYEYSAGGEVADFYLGKYIIEYHLKEDDSFDYGEVIRRPKAKSLFKIFKPLDFNLPSEVLISKLDGLTLLK